MILKKEQLLIKMLITESIINLGSFLDFCCVDCKSIAMCCLLRSELETTNCYEVTSHTCPDIDEVLR